MRLPVTSPPPSCPSPIHRDSQLALRAPSGGSDCKLNSPRLTLDSLLSSSLKRPLPGRAILPGDRCVCVIYNNKSPYLPQQNHSGFSITPGGIHFSPFLFHSDHALKALKSRLPPLPTLGLAEGTDGGRHRFTVIPSPHYLRGPDRRPYSAGRTASSPVGPGPGHPVSAVRLQMSKAFCFGGFCLPGEVRVRPNGLCGARCLKMTAYGLCVVIGASLAEGLCEAACTEPSAWEVEVFVWFTTCEAERAGPFLSPASVLTSPGFEEGWGQADRALGLGKGHSSGRSKVVPEALSPQVSLPAPGEGEAVPPEHLPGAGRHGGPARRAGSRSLLGELPLRCRTQPAAAPSPTA